MDAIGANSYPTQSDKNARAPSRTALRLVSATAAAVALTSIMAATGASDGVSFRWRLEDASADLRERRVCNLSPGRNGTASGFSSPGRTGGYHGVGQGDVDFPREANQRIWVIEPPSSGRAKVYSFPVADLPASLCW